MEVPDVYAARSRYVISCYHKKEDQAEMLRKCEPLKEMLSKYRMVGDGLPVCIIGAGAEGLYTAMILESLGISYDLVEASDHVGGRLFTYKGFKNAEPYDYFVSIDPSLSGQ